LETNFGADGSGGLSIPNSLATLSYDCRRSAFFEKELLATLKIIDRGHMSRAQLRGGWAGEIGPMQFLPSLLISNGVDFDGNGRINLVSSVPDMLASAAAYLKSQGWSAGGGWGPGTSNYGAIQAWNRATVYQKTIAKMADQLAR
jgi:membrane-bound lytic murein transglycosylase B